VISINLSKKRETENKLSKTYRLTNLQDARKFVK
jgi:hypothetical protein